MLSAPCYGLLFVVISRSSFLHNTRLDAAISRGAASSGDTKPQRKFLLGRCSAFALAIIVGKRRVIFKFTVLKVSAVCIRALARPRENCKCKRRLVSVLPAGLPLCCRCAVGNDCGQTISRGVCHDDEHNDHRRFASLAIYPRGRKYFIKAPD